MTKVRFLFAWRSLKRTNFSEFWATTMVARLSDGSLRLSDASPGQTRNLRFHNLFLIQKPLFDPPNTQNDLLHWLWVQYTTKHHKQFITTSSATQFNTFDQIIMFLKPSSNYHFQSNFPEIMHIYITTEM